MKCKWLPILAILVSLCLIFIPQRIQAAVLERPSDSTVLDKSHYLSEQTIRDIDEINRSWANTDEQLQVGVCIVEKIPDGSTLESVSNETFRKWQVGFAGTNNGVLLYIAMEDRQFRIETSDNASILLTDVEAKRILESARSFFRAKEYSEGVFYIVNAIGDSFYGTEEAPAILKDANLPKEEKRSFLLKVIIGILDFLSTESGSQLFVILIIFYFIFRNGGGNGGSSRKRSSGSRSGGRWSGGGGGGGGASSGW